MEARLTRFRTGGALWIACSWGKYPEGTITLWLEAVFVLAVMKMHGGLYNI